MRPITPEQGVRGRFAIIGFVLGLGAPAGWLFLRMLLHDVSPSEEIAGHLPLYLYLLIPTTFVFTMFGLAAGHIADRLRADKLALRRMAMYDELTGLYNRRSFPPLFESACARGRRYGRALSLLLLDLDDFKAINDNYGHEAGDAVLVDLGRVLHETIRESDIAARWGGEEFVIALPDTGVKGAGVLAERIREAVRRCDVIHQGRQLKPTASIGIASAVPRNGPCLGAFLRGADDAMYRAKHRGKNRVETQAPNFHPRNSDDETCSAS